MKVAYLCIQRQEGVDSNVSGTVNVLLDSLADIPETPAKVTVVSLNRPKRSLRGRLGFLSGVKGVIWHKNVLHIHMRSRIMNFKSLCALQMVPLKGVSKSSSKESKRTSLVPDWSQWCCSQYKSAKYT